MFGSSGSARVSDLMSKLSIKKAAAEFDTLSEEERRALRISRFHAQPPPTPSSSSHEPRPRLAHPGGPLATNKAAALAKFLKRKLNEPGGAASLDPALVERAVDNAKATALAGQEAAASSKVARVRHVDTFSDSDEDDVAQSRGNLRIDVQFKNRKTNKPKKNDFWCPNSKAIQNGHSTSIEKKKKKKKKNGKKKRQG